MSRYIDADKVLEKINKICNRCGEMNRNNGVMCCACKLDPVKDIIDDFPTEEVRPDIPGEWIPVVDDEGFVTKHKCSKCNAIGFRSMNFCPECGSRNFRRKEKMTDEEWKEIREKVQKKQLEVCARCVHSIVGTNTIECGVGIMQEVCPIQFMENHKEREDEE